MERVELRPIFAMYADPWFHLRHRVPRVFSATLLDHRQPQKLANPVRKSTDVKVIARGITTHFLKKLLTNSHCFSLNFMPSASQNAFLITTNWLYFAYLSRSDRRYTVRPQPNSPIAGA